MTITARPRILQVRITTDQLAELSFILFFSDALIRLVFQRVLGPNAVSTMAGILVPYIPLVVICVKKPSKYIKIDFVILYFMVLIFFASTILIHPEYEFHYMRSNYGVWDHVLKPYRGIYAYLFIRLLDDPKRIIKCMRTSGWLMMIYFVYRVIRGEWATVGARHVNLESSYSVTFGYEVLIFALVFMYSALTEKRNKYVIAAIADIMMILIGGSRGPILFVGLFVVLFFLIYAQESRKKWLTIFLAVLLSSVIYYFYTPLLYLLMGVLERFHLSSRFVKMMLAGTIANDNNRIRIWTAAIEMIKKNPFGYGAMGSRHVIYDYVYAGYPHSILLEFLIDYGVLLGGTLLLLFFGYSFSILFSKKHKAWSGTYLPYFCACSAMFISLTYWSRPEFWACVAMEVCCYRSSRREKRRNRQLTAPISRKK